jgi:hypothetical protein
MHSSSKSVRIMREGVGLSLIPLVLLLTLGTLATPASGARTIAGEHVNGKLEVARTPTIPIPNDNDRLLLFDSGTPETDPFSFCGNCYAWSSTYYNSPTNFDLTARAFTVPAGSFATSFRIWWVYGEDGPYPNDANHGGSADDFSRISIDLYDMTGPDGAPGNLIANLDGTWVVLDEPTNYREYQLESPFVFSDTHYFASIRAETPEQDYDAVILWLNCAPSDTLMDWENLLNDGGSTGGWVRYDELEPCPEDQDFGLQVLGGVTPDAVDVVPEPGCITEDGACKRLTVEFNRVSADSARAISVKFGLSPELMLCDPDPYVSIEQGPWLQDYSNHFEIIDHGGGFYSVDQAILGEPCGITTGGILFWVDITNTEDEGVGSVTIDSVRVRDCDNMPLPGVPGAPASVIVDTNPPATVVDLSATQIKFGNDSDGTTKILLDFTPPDDFEILEIYRAKFGFYPEYDDAGGGVPPLPSFPPDDRWTLIDVTTPGEIDETTERDYWYYVIFTQDACGNASAVSNMTSGTLNYHLGDISPMGPPGDNLVRTMDASAMQATYHRESGDSGYNPHADVGPTWNGEDDGLPYTDNIVNFNDLFVLANNFLDVGIQDQEDPAVEVQGDSEDDRPSLVLEVESRPGNELFARLILQGNTQVVKGIHSLIAYDRGRIDLLDVQRGSLLDQQSAPLFFIDLDVESGHLVDLAALGPDQVIEGSGDLAELHFRVLQKEAKLVLVEFVLWDVRNGQVVAGRKGAQGTPDIKSPASAETGFLGARPNPFNGTTNLLYSLRVWQAVEFRIYDIRGRLLRTLVDGYMPAGRHHVVWDGSTDDGRRVGSGVYLYTFRLANHETSGKIFRLR